MLSFVAICKGMLPLQASVRDKDMNSTPINGKNDYSVDVDDENHFQNPSTLNPPLNRLPKTFNYTFPRGSIEFLINTWYVCLFISRGLSIITLLGTSRLSIF